MTAPTRAALSRELIAKTALTLTDTAGLAGLSMRKLGNELGVEAMSLYHYVDNKDDLLDAILDSLYAEIQLPFDLPDAEWEQGIRRGFRSFHDVLVRHPAALELFASRPARSAEAIGVLMWAYGRFQAIGLDVPQSCKALHFGVSFVMGHVAGLAAMALISAGGGIDLDQVGDPILVEMITVRRSLSSDQLFEAGMDAVVAGLREAFDLP